MQNWRSMKAYTEEDMDSILNRLDETARRLNVTIEDIVVKVFIKNNETVPRRTKDCFTIEELERSWPYVPIHVHDCYFCQRLVLSAFPGVLVEPDSDLVSEVTEVQAYFHGKCPSCCFPITQFGRQLFFSIPLRKNLSHVRECLFCQFLLHYHQDDEQDRLHLGCLDMDGWRVYPLFSPQDLYNITEHIIKRCRCIIEKCSGRAVLRFRFNALKDRDKFRQLKKRSRLWLKWKIFINEFIKRPIGNEISLRRFEHNPFGKKHPWLVWKREDGLLRLLTARELSLEERLYRELLENPGREQEIVGRLIATFPGYKPWNWEYKLPDWPLLWNRWAIIEFLRLEEESRQRRISIDELKAIEKEEDKKSDEEIWAKLESRRKQKKSENA